MGWIVEKVFWDVWETREESVEVVCQTSSCIRTQDSGTGCRLSLCGLDVTSICSIYLSIPGSVEGCPHTWKPLSCSFNSWRWRVCMLLMIRLWWPISSTPIRLTSLGREGKHKNTSVHETTLKIFMDLKLWSFYYVPHLKCYTAPSGPHRDWTEIPLRLHFCCGSL